MTKRRIIALLILMAAVAIFVALVPSRQPAGFFSAKLVDRGGGEIVIDLTNHIGVPIAFSVAPSGVVVGSLIDPHRSWRYTGPSPSLAPSGTLMVIAYPRSPRLRRLLNSLLWCVGKPDWENPTLEYVTLFYGETNSTKWVRSLRQDQIYITE